MRVYLPHALQALADGEAAVAVDGPAATVREALAQVWARYPGVRDRVITERGEVRPHVNVFVDGEAIRSLDGLDTQVRPDSQLHILAAVSGG